MILDSARRIGIGSLVIVRALGRNGAIADRKIPTAYHLQVVIAHAEDPLLRGKRFKVRPLTRYISDQERQRSDLVPLEAFGMKVAEVGRYPHGLAFLRVERDPNLVPEVDEPWGNPFDRTGFTDFLNYSTSVDEGAEPFIAELAAKGMAA
jgi:hypothetical protein